MDRAEPARSTLRVEILLLAIVGGGVDAVIMLGFGVLTAAQTGNTILLAVALSLHHFAIGLSSAVSIGSYIAGAALGELLIDARRGRLSRTPRVRAALAFELIAVVTLLILWHAMGSSPSTRTSLPLVVLAAVAMGMQSATVLRLHAGPATTYVTGTLTTFTVDVIRWPHLVETSTGESSAFTGHRPWIYGVTWLIYLGGAMTTGLLYLSFGSTALLLPIAAILVVLVIASRSPITSLPRQLPCELPPRSSSAT
jgi:uncharacterized membrane protein YoaK (UPF0700 family)